MDLSEVVLGPDPRLSEVCEPIETIDESTKKLAEHMLDIMYASQGCGLAGPQIGVMKQICVIDVDWGDNTKKNPYVLINPQVVETSGDLQVGSEGCLSWPGITVEVERPTHVVVHARNLEGKLMRYEAHDNLMCVCMQHEIDHLNGKSMIDHLGPIARMNAMRDYKKARELGRVPGDTE